MRSPAKTARVAAPHLVRLLNDQDVQRNVLRGMRSARGLYVRAREKKPAQAADGQKLRDRSRETVEVPEPPRKKRKLRGVRGLLTLGLAGGAVLLAVNSDVRERTLALIGQGRASDPPYPAEGRQNVQ